LFFAENCTFAFKKVVKNDRKIIGEGTGTFSHPVGRFDKSEARIGVVGEVDSLAIH
jgi:hypothetical protein